jgi:hypothetical protein
VIALAAIIGVTIAILWMRGGSGRVKPDAPLPVRTSLPAVAPPTAAFVDITREAGITFSHENGAAGDKLLPETMGGGVAFLDFDNDGKPDLLFVDSRPWPSAGTRHDPPARSRLVLYRNVGGGRFADVTASSGLGADIYAWASPPQTTTTTAGPICSSPPSASIISSIMSVDISPT